MTKKLPARPRVLVLEGLSNAAACVRRAGGDVVVVSPRDCDAVEQALDEGVADALLLTGGGDVDPRRYNRRAHQMTYGVSEDRDRSEFTALRYARDYDLPVLGICRGAQVMNVAAGGTLIQHLPPLLGGARRHTSGRQRTEFTPGSLAAAAVGQLTVSTVHLHHQAVQQIGRGYRVSARHADGTIEAIESTDGVWRVGVQFHPEMARGPAAELGLFRALVVQAALLSRLPVPPVRKPAQRRAAPVREPWHGVTSSIETRWRCFRCHDMDFDERLDFVDHMFEIHHVDLEHGSRSLEQHVTSRRDLR